jgi:hypothetical protein
MNNGDKPINAVNGINGALFVGHGADKSFIESQNPLIGLTKREYFAAMAMQGLMAGDSKDSMEEFAKYSVKMADALLKALES